jgi:hypothetical protein
MPSERKTCPVAIAAICFDTKAERSQAVAFSGHQGYQGSLATNYTAQTFSSFYRKAPSNMGIKAVVPKYRFHQ